jgi:hypothetical protein
MKRLLTRLYHWYLARIKYRRRRPNAVTRRALDQLDDDAHLLRFASPDELFRALDAED